MNLQILAQPLRILVLAACLGFIALSAAAQEQATDDPQQALSQLIEVLRDDAARDALIAELEAGLETPDAAPAEEASPSPSADLRSLGGRIADFTDETATGFVNALGELWRQLAAAPSIFAGLDIAALDALGGVAGDVAILVLVTYGGLIVLRRMAGGSRARLQHLFRYGGWLGKPMALVLGFALGIATALVPYALGYGVAAGLLADQGEMALEHTLYLNSFLMIEIILAALRSVVSPHRPEQRLVHVSDGAARAIMGWGRVLTSLFIYGQMMALPLVSAAVSGAAGRALSVALLLVTLGVAALAVLVARRPVRHKLSDLTGQGETARGLRLPIRYWHVFALVYLGVLAIVVLTRSSDEVQAYLWSNARIAIVILVGFIVLNVIKRTLANGVSLPESLRRRSPELQRQLNGIVPAVLQVVRALVVLAVVVTCLHGLGFFNFLDFIESEFGARVTGSTLTILIILTFAIIAWIALNAWVDGQVNPALAPRATARRRTLFVLMRNAATIAIIVITLMFVLSEIGINIAPLIASAGVIGLAIGFGAQKLVQDIINGIFIQFEGAIDVGDIISVGGITGEAERLTIRSVAVRDLEGSYHIVPFSSVDTVTNFMRGFSYALVHMGVSYREDADYVKAAMFDAFEQLRADPAFKPVIVGDFEWSGVNEFGASEVIFRTRIKTLPGQQWAVRRAYYGILKRVFDERGIEIPYPHQTVYFGEDKAGKAPPLRVVSQTAAEATQGQGTAPTPIQQTDEGIVVPPPAKASRRRSGGKTGRASVDNQMPDIDSGPDSDKG